MPYSHIVSFYKIALGKALIAVIILYQCCEANCIEGNSSHTTDGRRVAIFAANL